MTYWIPHISPRLTVILVCFLMIAVFSSRVSGKEAQLPQEKLSKILNRHAAWLNSIHLEEFGENSPADIPVVEKILWNWDKFIQNIGDSRVASLAKSDLSHRDLRNASLAFADLRNANLANAQLQGANLVGARLENANLISADMTGAMLIGANLAGARLDHAILRHINELKWAQPSIHTLFEDTRLWNTDLRGANLAYAVLRDAYIHNALLGDGLSLYSADMEGVSFSPRISSLPNPQAFQFTHNLWKMDYWGSSLPALSAIFHGLKDAGDRENAVQVLYVINKARGNGLERLLRGVFFDLTCRYGMSSARPIIILLLLVLVFGAIYSFALRDRPKSRAGIWLVWPNDRVEKDLGQDIPERIIAKTLWQRTWISVYFSIISAFQLGWRELNIGGWISRCQSREYILRGTGWVRAVSGIQAIVSVYLLALSVLSYFGYPFE